MKTLKSLVTNEKQKCHTNFVEDLKESSERQWYLKLKKVITF